MKKSQLILQEKNNYCLCSVLQGILSERDLIVSQDYIALNLTPSEKGFRADDARIKEFMENKGFDYQFYWWNTTPLNEPDSLLKEISMNDGFLGVGIHTYRILDFKDPKIITDNPEDSSKKIFNIYNLMKDFSKTDGGFGLIKKLK
jgi:hypothetical protein